MALLCPPIVYSSCIIHAQITPVATRDFKVAAQWPRWKPAKLKAKTALAHYCESFSTLFVCRDCQRAATIDHHAANSRALNELASPCISHDSLAVLTSMLPHDSLAVRTFMLPHDEQGLYEDLVHTLAGLGLYLTLIVPADGNQCLSCWAVLAYIHVPTFASSAHHSTQKLSYFTLSVEPWEWTYWSAGRPCSLYPARDWIHCHYWYVARAGV